jgi:pimeloyl-ACP methyl ester carboxylesterase
MKLRTVELDESMTSAIAEAGTGGEPVMLLHGFTGAKEDFADWLDPLADLGWHAVAPDHRGHGSSSQPPDEGAYSLATMAADTFALADDLGWARFALLGHSMGGMVAQVMALQAPERIGRLVLMDTSHGPVEGVDPGLAAMAVELARSDGIAALADAVAALDNPLASLADLRVRAERPGYAEFGDRKLRACSPAMYAAMAVEMFEQPDRLDALRSLRMPVLVLVGEQDTGFLPSARRLADAIAGSHLEVIADAGHSPQFEAPDDWWAALSAFLSDEAPRRAAANG